MGGQSSSTNTSGTNYIRYTGDPYRDELTDTGAREYGRARSFADLIAGGIGYGSARNYGKPVGGKPSAASITRGSSAGPNGDPTLGPGSGGPPAGGNQTIVGLGPKPPLGGGSTPPTKPVIGSISGGGGAGGDSGGQLGPRSGDATTGGGMFKDMSSEDLSRKAAQNFTSIQRPRGSFEEQLAGIRLQPGESSYQGLTIDDDERASRRGGRPGGGWE